MKKCTQCGEELDESSFYKDKGNLDGLRSNCKSCQNKRREDWRRRHPENVKRSCKKYYSTHSEKWQQQEANKSDDQRERKRQYARQYFQEHKDEILAKNKERYGRKLEGEKKSYSQKYYDTHKEQICARAKINYVQLTDEQKAAKVEAVRLFRKNNKDKAKAWSTVGNALIRGEIIKPTTCSICGQEERLHGHHEDYSKPLEVKWLCHGCHMNEHSKLRRK